jgi:hypothetical protein
MRITPNTMRLRDLHAQLQTLPRPAGERREIGREGTRTIAAALYLLDMADDSTPASLRDFVAQSRVDLERFAQILGQDDPAVCIVREMMALVSGEIPPPRPQLPRSLDLEEEHDDPEDDLDDGFEDDLDDLDDADELEGGLADKEIDLSKCLCPGCGRFTTCMKCYDCGTWMPGFRPFEPEPRRGRGQPSLIVPLLVLAAIAVLGWLGYRYLRQRSAGAAPVTVRANALRHVPADWLVVQGDPVQLEAYLSRLPAVKKWLAKFDDLERQLPATEEDRLLDRLGAGTQWSLFAASPATVAWVVWFLQGPGNLAAPPNDLAGMVRQLRFQEEILKREPEFAFLNVKSGAYRPERVLPGRLAAGALGGKQAWRVGGEYLVEAETGVLVRGVNRAGVARLATPITPVPNHQPAPPGAALVLQLSPNFWRAPVWQGAFAADRKFDPAKIGTLQIIARLAAAAITVEVRVPIRDDTLLKEARHFLADQTRPGKSPPPSWMKDMRAAIDGRTYVLRFEIPDAAIDRLIPTPEQVQSDMAVLQQVRRMFERR